MNQTTLSDFDEGKTVVGPAGDEIGRVASVANGRAHVEPDRGVADAVMSKLGWGRPEEGTYLIETDSIDAITEDEVRLRPL